MSCTGKEIYFNFLTFVQFDYSLTINGGILIAAGEGANMYGFILRKSFFASLLFSSFTSNALFDNLSDISYHYKRSCIQTQYDITLLAAMPLLLYSWLLTEQAYQEVHLQKGVYYSIVQASKAVCKKIGLSINTLAHESICNAFSPAIFAAACFGVIENYFSKNETVHLALTCGTAVLSTILCYCQYDKKQAAETKGASILTLSMIYARLAYVIQLHR